jgi:hypothetical protein
MQGIAIFLLFMACYLRIKGKYFLALWSGERNGRPTAAG